MKSGQGLRAFRSSLEGPFFTRSPEMKPFKTIRLQCESNHLRLTYRSRSQEKCRTSLSFANGNPGMEHCDDACICGFLHVSVVQLRTRATCKFRRSARDPLCQSITICFFLSNHSDLFVADCCSGKVFNKSCTIQTCNRTLQGCEAPPCGTSLDDSNSWHSKHWKVLMGFVCWISGFPKAKQGPLF